MKILKTKRSFPLESGESLPELEIAYDTYGKFSPEKKVIWACHALTANSDVFDWWKGLFGDGCLFNPDDYFIVCANFIGSHYGTTSPLNVNPENGKPYYHSFPQFTIRDMVNAHELVRRHLQIERIHAVLGGSMGGQQALEWSIINPGLFENLVLIATNAKHSSWGIAFNQSQRLCIENDPTWKEENPDAGLHGMKVARSLALLSYRNYSTYTKRQEEEHDEKIDSFKASSYQVYQGEKLAKRFNAFSYWYLSKAMDSHNIGRGRGGILKALKKIKARTLCIGISSDILFPLEEQLFLARNIENAEFAAINSLYGHDGFLIETEQIARVISGFLNSTAKKEIVQERKIAVSIS